MRLYNWCWQTPITGFTDLPLEKRLKALNYCGNSYIIVTIQ